MNWKNFAVFLLIATAVQNLVLYGPVPILDNGHRLVGVCNKEALATVVNVMEATSSMRLDYAFAYGTTEQALFKDGYTVVNWLFSSKCRAEITPATGDGISLAVADPKVAAEKAAQMFKQAGFKAEVEEFMPGKLYLCRTTALNSAELVYRKPALQMGGKPPTVKIR